MDSLVRTNQRSAALNDCPSDRWVRIRTDDCQPQNGTFGLGLELLWVKMLRVRFRANFRPNPNFDGTVRENLIHDRKELACCCRREDRRVGHGFCIGTWFYRTFCRSKAKTLSELPKIMAYLDLRARHTDDQSSCAASQRIGSASQRSSGRQTGFNVTHNLVRAAALRQSAYAANQRT